MRGVEGGVELGGGGHLQGVQGVGLCVCERVGGAQGPVVHGGAHHGREWPQHRRRQHCIAAARHQVEAEGDHVEERDGGGDAQQPAAQRCGQRGACAGREQ